METTRIQIADGESVELYIHRQQEEVRHYSTVAVCDGSKDPEPVEIRNRLSVLVSLRGPVTLCIVKK